MQSFLAQGGQRSTGASTKSIFPGKDELSSIYKFTEAKRDSNYYDQKEKEILQESKEVKDLIESLETLESIKDETKT